MGIDVNARVLLLDQAEAARAALENVYDLAPPMMLLVAVERRPWPHPRGSRRRHPGEFTVPSAVSLLRRHCSQRPTRAHTSNDQLDLLEGGGRQLASSVRSSWTSGFGGAI